MNCVISYRHGLLLASRELVGIPVQVKLHITPGHQLGHAAIYLGFGLALQFERHMRDVNSAKKNSSPTQNGEVLRVQRIFDATGNQLRKVLIRDHGGQAIQPGLACVA